MYYSIPRKWTQSVGQWHNPRSWLSVVVLAMVRLCSELPTALLVSCYCSRRLRQVRTAGWLSLHTTSFCELQTPTGAVINCKTWWGKLTDANRITDYYLCTQWVQRHAWSKHSSFKNLFRDNSDTIDPNLHGVIDQHYHGHKLRAPSK